MNRIVMMVLRNWYYVPFKWIKLCWYAAHADKYTDYEHNLLLRDIVYHANKGGRVTKKVKKVCDINLTYAGDYDIIVSSQQGASKIKGFR